MPVVPDVQARVLVPALTTPSTVAGTQITESPPVLEMKAGGLGASKVTVTVPVIEAAPQIINRRSEVTARGKYWQWRWGPKKARRSQYGGKFESLSPLRKTEYFKRVKRRGNANRRRRISA